MSFKATYSLAHIPWVRAALKPFAGPYVTAAGYRKVGLKYDDLVQIDADPVATEALRRLPAHEADARIFRMRRAIQCDLTHSLLPKEQWIRPEEDTRYLTPIVKDVAAEFAEREAFDTGKVVVQH
ncbi:Cytochrome b-c1 complex subunit 7 [Dimargaris cristalligena]|uniref:Cytochrome b-c1 complex subunit 7 n=1 Tax=Dimargaris cristalligena TaxID=215637 RepID=A0A4P9ZY05_9FUNG|nr:Cytochrome b-c1 complex subunit 7 [Dimargaris cristalligena]RKP38615.1 putative ubiquinol-cytochrome C reductase complex 14kD subunit [Dimargaris cristalligena]|eukprot:RKP38615.1 putative ubiquinol-cytochrome C reductase complex 14kD subunit [Dimargaris cristalligena]